MTGVRFTRPDGAQEMLGCKALVLACCGFAGDAEMVRKHIPEIADAECCGHLSNTGDAVKWGEALVRVWPIWEPTRDMALWRIRMVCH